MQMQQLHGVVTGFGNGTFRLSPNSIQAPAAGGKFVLVVEGSNTVSLKLGQAVRRMPWRSVVSANNGMRVRTVDQHAQGSVTVIVEPSAVEVRLEARVSIQVLDHNRWIDVGADASVAQAP